MTLFPLFGRLRRDVDVDLLAGGSSPPPIVLPVELTLVPDAVKDVAGAASALRHCVHLCTLLGHQRKLMKNTYYLRVALIQHLFTRVLPMPMPLNHPQRQDYCFWASQKIRYVETSVFACVQWCSAAKHVPSLSDGYKLLPR